MPNRLTERSAAFPSAAVSALQQRAAGGWSEATDRNCCTAVSGNSSVNDKLVYLERLSSQRSELRRFRSPKAAL